MSLSDRECRARRSSSADENKKTRKEQCHGYSTRSPPGTRRRIPPGLPGRAGRGRLRGARQPAQHRRPGRRRARAADQALGRSVLWFTTLQYGGSNATSVDLISRLAVAAVGAVALASPPRVFRPAARQPAAGHLADHLPAHPGPQAPRRPRDVLVQQLLRRGADRLRGGRPRLRGPAPNRPLTAPGVRALRARARTRAAQRPCAAR